MKEYFKEDDVAERVTNCPQCGLIVEKEEGGCNHMICAKCKYEFCWVCGMKYTVNHFDANNVFGCQGLQTTTPNSRCKLILKSLAALIFVPFVLLFYPIYVTSQAYYNPFNMPRSFRWMCICRACSAEAPSCLAFVFHLIFYPFENSSDTSWILCTLLRD